ncbi:hypothetical protein, partial [Mediterraneibacter gnavus]|uniref:hypothetical protein n=1 Tax=Mediterraneibacter gnavus TaxID=33038 RepID=UPI001A9BB33E
TYKCIKKAEKKAFVVIKTLIIRFGTYNFKKDFSTPQDFGLGEFLMCILLEDNGIIYIGIRKQAM